MADNTGTCVVAVQPMSKIACTTHNCSNRAAYVIGHPAKVGHNKYQICEPCMKNVLRSAKKLGLLDELVGEEFMNVTEAAQIEVKDHDLREDESILVEAGKDSLAAGGDQDAEVTGDAEQAPDSPTEEFLALSVSTDMKKAELLAIVATYSVLGVTEDNNKSEIVAKIQEVQAALYKETTREAPKEGEPVE